MSDTPQPDQETPEELTPEARQILKRARRSFGVSLGILLLGFMAIGFALVYRAMRDAPPPEMAQSIELPAQAEIVSSHVAEGAINVTYRIDGVVTLALFDVTTGTFLHSIRIGEVQRP